MGKGKNAESEENKVETPVQGAEGSADTANEVKPGEAGQTQDDDASAEKPEWAQELLDSNKAVIESNEEVVEAIDRLFEDLPKQFKELEATASKEDPEAKTVSVDAKARYVVSKGKKFLDTESGKTLTQGTDVSKLPTAKLEALLTRGIIEAK